MNLRDLIFSSQNRVGQEAYFEGVSLTNRTNQHILIWPKTCNIASNKLPLSVDLEPAVKPRTSLTPIFFIIIMSAILMMPACSPMPSAGASVPVYTGGDHTQAQSPANSIPESAVDIPDIPASNDSATPDGMVAFEGKVFVALTVPKTGRWQQAGWRVGDQPVNTDIQQAPLDCSLNPHSGVQDQWVGGCQGYVLIPQDGAEHIAVMVIKPDGSSTMVQIAPPPGSSTP